MTVYFGTKPDEFEKVEPEASIIDREKLEEVRSKCEELEKAIREITEPGRHLKRGETVRESAFLQAASAVFRELKKMEGAIDYAEGYK